MRKVLRSGGSALLFVIHARKKWRGGSAALQLEQRFLAEVQPLLV